MRDSKCVRLRISGRVQGVFYRASARTAATRLQLRGWVRNCPDGSVEALVGGGEPAVDAFIDWCRSGPPGARVHDVDVEPTPGDELPAGFEIRF